MPTSSFPKTEVRFAVVMYGGVSLAIYMNGIAQELLRMVRATATKDSDNHPLINYRDLDAVEQVYRKLAYCHTGRLDAATEQTLLETNAPLTRKFVIDIISGTSAGGINGIFLAKALANCQKIDELKNLWITEGDVNLLINDKNSVKDNNLKLQKEPASLFNSQRMYLKLLEAFKSMEKGGDTRVDSKTTSSYVSELDLFVTATDILGLTLPIKLADSTVYERKHKTVFRFSYSGSSGDLNDFEAVNNPMLAFAARSTSSFPFAFEPMCFTDIDAVLDSLKSGRDSYAANPKWKRFFKNYPDVAGNGSVPYKDRPFGDGGYLDNKPFTYAIDTISERSSDYPIDRKLLYIEPAPEDPQLAVEHAGKPDAIQNSLAALLTLPRVETIREDLEKIFEKNRLTERVERIIKNIERDKSALKGVSGSYRKWQPQEQHELQPLWAKENLSDKEWGELDMEDMIKRRGLGYVGYHRLEIAVVTDDFGKLLTRVAGFDEESNYFLVFRYLMKAWRVLQYTEYRQEGSARPTTNAFLHSFDLTYPVRRLKFLVRQIDRLSLLEQGKYEEEMGNYFEWIVRTPVISPNKIQLSQEWIAEFRLSLLEIKREINQQLVLLTKAGRALRSRFMPEQELAGKIPPSPIYHDVAKLIDLLVACFPQAGEGKREVCNLKKSFEPVIHYFFGSTDGAVSSDDECQVTDEEDGDEKAKALLKNHEELQALLTVIALIVENNLKPVMEGSDAACRNILLGGSDTTATETARSILWSYYRKYSDFDMIIFPVTYGTAGGEGDRVDVARISSEDAKLLINEREMKLHKLAGTSLGSFGAFMEKRWRQNDIMWGQLDGAERIISLLMPDKKAAQAFIGEAQAAIVLETIAPMGRKERYDLLVEPFMRPGNGKPYPEALSKFTVDLKKNAGEPLASKLDEEFSNKELRDHYLDIFERNKSLEPESALKNGARATSVLGKMLTGIANQNTVPGRKYIPLVTTASRFFLALVDAATPRSFSNLIVHHWINLLYLFEVVLFVGGIVFLNSSVESFALIAFAATAAVHLTLFWLQRKMRFKSKLPDLLKRIISILLKSLAVVVIVLLIGSGLAVLYALLGFQESWWSSFQQVHELIRVHFWNK